MWRSRWRYGLAAVNFHREAASLGKSQHGKLLSLQGSRALSSLRFAESWCSASLVWQGPILWEGRHVPLILPHQPRHGHSTGKRRQLFWIWKTALVWQPVLWEHTRVSATLNLAALGDESSGNPRRCNSPAARAQSTSCGSSIGQECPR